MGLSPYDLRPDLAVYFPDGTDPADVSVVAAGRPLPRGASVAVLHGHAALHDKQAHALPHRHALWAVPRGPRMPRALVPNADRLAAHTLLAPRASTDRLTGRAFSIGVRKLPAAALIRLGRPIVVAARERSPIVSALEAAVPSAAVGCYLGNASNTGRSSAQAFLDGTVCAIAKVVQEPEGRARVAREEGLLIALGAMPAISSRVPKLVGRLTTALGEVLITDAFSGLPAATVVDSHVRRFLDLCWLERSYRPARDSELFCRTVYAALAAGYAAVSDRAATFLAGEVVPTVITHGDFVPWNLRVSDGAVKAFDWEYGCIDGLPGWDELFFRIQVGLTYRRWTRSQLASAIRRWLSKPVAPWSAIGQQGLATLVLLDLAERYQRHAYTSYERVTLDAARDLAA